jgi:1,2-diacylglycerol 3-alpha-glucosyltransferase
MRIALLCSGLGNIRRGHETFASELFTLLRNDLDITLLKGGGEANAREIVVPHLERNSPLLASVHVPVASKWAAAAREQEQMRIECETFAMAALRPLLAGDFDVLHCLELEVCNVLHDNRHLFAKVPQVLFSNGGAIPAAELPRCDFVQEHTESNLRRSRRQGAFCIPHGVDRTRFHPRVSSDFRRRHGIPENAFVVIAVGTICYSHKRTDHVIREVAQLDGAWLVLCGQLGPDSPAILQLGRELLGDRLVVATLRHDDLPQAYAAANAFALGSLFETFGIVYIEAMAMGLPVFCTRHENQRSIVREGVFVDMQKPGELARALRETPKERLRELAVRGPAIVAEHYDLELLKRRYLERYAAIAATPPALPGPTVGGRVRAHFGNLLKRARRGFR